MLRRHIPQSWNQIGFLLVAGIFFYAAFRTAFNTDRQNEKQEDWSGGQKAEGVGAKASCFGAANHGDWMLEASQKCSDAGQNTANCNEDFEKSWVWDAEAVKCGVKRQSKADLTSLLTDGWIAVIGDSVGRMLFAALLRLLGDGGDYPIHKAHQDFEYTLPENVKASFFWAPYPANASEFLSSMYVHDSAPDFIVVSVGLWHMLHVTSAKGFSQDLETLKGTAEIFQSSHSQHEGSTGSRHMSFCSISEVQPELLVAENKRQRMTRDNVLRYNNALTASEVLAPAGPFSLIDVHGITAGCGSRCSEDGVHYHNATYDVMLQVWANAVMQDLRH